MIGNGQEESAGQVGSLDAIGVRNPVLPGDHPDPSVVRVGNDYYLMSLRRAGRIDHFIDPSIFNDDDGRRYLVFGGGWVHELAADGSRLVGEAKQVWRGTGGIAPEGPHILKRNGWYYMLLSEGGIFFGHCCTLARSRSVWGPHEACPRNPNNRCGSAAAEGGTRQAGRSRGRQLVDEAPGRPPADVERRHAAWPRDFPGAGPLDGRRLARRRRRRAAGRAGAENGGRAGGRKERGFGAAGRDVHRRFCGRCDRSGL